MSAVVRQYTLQNPLTCKADGSSPTGLGVEGFTLTFDRTWAPYGQLQLRTLAPSAANLAGLDPRTGLRVRFGITQDNLAGDVATLTADLALRSRAVQWVPGTGTLTAATREAELQDWGYIGGEARPTVLQGLGLIGQNVFGLPGTSWLADQSGPDLSLGTDPADWGDAGNWGPDQSAWDFGAGLAQQAGGWLWSDESGVFRYTSTSWAADSTRRYFDEATNLIDVEDDVTREDGVWANHAVVAYQPPGGGATSYVQYPTNPNQPGTPSQVSRRTIRTTFARKKPATGNRAQSILAQASRRGRRLVLTSLADIRCRPNQPATASYAGQSFSGTLESVAFTFPEGTQQSVLAVVE